MIDDLVERLGLDTDKTTQHAYGPFYDEALAPYRKWPVRLLEIGVQVGGSLRLWNAYFEGRAEIVGVDIGMHWDSLVDLPGSVSLYEADAYTEWTAARLGDFDIIIDDGLHTLASQVAAIRLYAPRLRACGLMVIEDVQQHGWTGILATEVPYGCRHRVVDLTAGTGVTDDRLFVIERFD